MPAKSKKQERFMQAVANNPKFAKKVGVPTKVGKEFTKETKVKKYKEGGMSEKDKELFGETEMDQKPPKGFKKSEKPMNEGIKELKKKAPEVVKKMGYKKGGMTKKKYCKDGCAVKGKTKGRMV